MNASRASTLDDDNNNHNNNDDIKRNNNDTYNIIYVCIYIYIEREIDILSMRGYFRLLNGEPRKYTR